MLLYLYQLVQALRYENWHDILSVLPEASNESKSELDHTNSINHHNDNDEIVQQTEKHEPGKSKPKRSLKSHKNKCQDSKLKLNSMTNVTSTSSHVESVTTNDFDHPNNEELFKWPNILNYSWKVS